MHGKGWDFSRLESPRDRKLVNIVYKKSADHTILNKASLAGIGVYSGSFSFLPLDGHRGVLCFSHGDQMTNSSKG